MRRFLINARPTRFGSYNAVNEGSLITAAIRGMKAAPPTKDNSDVLRGHVNASLGQRWDPFYPTSQERWFIDNMIARWRDKHVIVTTFRGCRKTTTLNRLRLRWWRYLRHLPFRRVVFYDQSNVEELY